MLIVLGMVFLGAVFFVWRAKRIASLDWPRNMTSPGFKSRVRWMLKKHRWSYTEPLFYPFPFMARKGNATVVLVCMHNSDSMTPMKLSDLDGDKKLRGMKQIVCITAEPLSEAFRQIAREKRIHLLYYKNLKSFVSLPSSETKTIKAYFETASKT